MLTFLVAIIARVNFLWFTRIGGIFNTIQTGGKDGMFNIAGYSNPLLDELNKKIQVELDAEKRNEAIGRALKLLKEDFAYIPLHQQVVVWASRANVDLAQTGDNFFQLRFVKLR